MKRLHPLWIVSGLLSMAADLAAILGYLFGPLAFEPWRPDPELVAALSFVLLAYALTIGATCIGHWASQRATRADPLVLRATAFLLNALATLPLLTLWLNLLFTLVLYTDVSTTLRWVLALAHAWIATPFVALGLTFAGEALAPRLASDHRTDQASTQGSSEQPGSGSVSNHSIPP
ncbi:MAG: hypothetical protein AB1449_03480 [Chloroflexota bacterium]